MTIPFSTESVSRGSPANCQLRMLTGSPRILRMVELGVCGNDFATNDFIQSAIIAVRYSPWVNTERNVSARIEELVLKDLITLVISGDFSSDHRTLLSNGNLPLSLKTGQ